MTTFKLFLTAACKNTPFFGENKILPKLNFFVLIHVLFEL